MWQFVPGTIGIPGQELNLLAQEPPANCCLPENYLQQLIYGISHGNHDR